MKLIKKMLFHCKNHIFMQVLLDLCSIVSDLARSKNILFKKKQKTNKTVGTYNLGQKVVDKITKL